MSRPRLQCVYSQPCFSDEFDFDPQESPGRRCWENASMRLVRNAKRARELRRRGVEVIDTGERTRTGRVVFAWFVESNIGDDQHDTYDSDDRVRDADAFGERGNTGPAARA